MAQAYTLGVCWTLQARDPTTLPLCLETTRSETETVSGRSPVAQSCVACVFVHSVPLSVYRVCAPKSFEFMLNGQRPSRLFEIRVLTCRNSGGHGTARRVMPRAGTYFPLHVLYKNVLRRRPGTWHVRTLIHISNKREGLWPLSISSNDFGAHTR